MFTETDSSNRIEPEVAFLRLIVRMQMEIKNRTQYEWLALRCQSGEAGAFEDLIAVMERPLLYYATSLTGNPESALKLKAERFWTLDERQARLAEAVGLNTNS